jgi:hypothetical protein
VPVSKARLIISSYAGAPAIRAVLLFFFCRIERSAERGWATRARAGQQLGRAATSTTHVDAISMHHIHADEDITITEASLPRQFSADSRVDRFSCSKAKRTEFVTQRNYR